MTLGDKLLIDKYKLSLLDDREAAFWPMTTNFLLTLLDAFVLLLYFLLVLLLVFFFARLINFGFDVVAGFEGGSKGLSVVVSDGSGTLLQDTFARGLLLEVDSIKNVFGCSVALDG